MADYWDEYLWFVIVGVFIAFFMAYGIGANDVANAFATSVGSKALKLWQAVIIAGIFEFAGAVTLGRGVTSTIRKGVIKLDAFVGKPAVLAYANLCALTAAAIWLIIATYCELPVSTTHSIIGGLVGAALVSEGGDAVVWYEETNDGIQFKGISAIVVSWVLSPVLSGVVAAIFFLAARHLVLRADNAYKRTFFFFPVLVFIAVWINLWYVLDKGVTKQVSMEWWESLWIAAVCAAGVAIVTGICMPCLKKQLDKEAERAVAITAQGVTLTKEEAEAKGMEVASGEDDLENGDKTQVKVGKADTKSEGGTSFFDRAKAGVNHDVFDAVHTDDVVSNIHANAEVFDPRAESAFRYLQVFTACCDSFAHGANDVANAVGPFAAIWDIYRHATVAKKSSVPIWILCIGGAGIVLGLATYGYKIIAAIGVKLVKITPSRGFSIEMGSAIVIATGSRLELPLSTTHCQVGATVAIGLLEHGPKGVNGRLFLNTCCGWILTLVLVGLMSAVIMAWGVYTPNINSEDALIKIRDTLNTSTIELTDHLAICQTGVPVGNVDYTSNLEFTDAYADGVATDVRFPLRIADVMQYNTDLVVSSTATQCPIDIATVSLVPPEIRSEYPVESE